MHRLLLGLAALVLALGACSGDDSADSDQTPEDRLAAAKSGFDEAEFVEFTLATESLPDSLDAGLLSAEGTGTHDPAFTGEVDVKTQLGPITAPLVAVDGTVYAELPFTGWSELDPAKYGAPDPAGLMDTESGISSLFTATEDATEAGSDADRALALRALAPLEHSRAPPNTGVAPRREEATLADSARPGAPDRAKEYWDRLQREYPRSDAAKRIQKTTDGRGAQGAQHTGPKENR